MSLITTYASAAAIPADGDFVKSLNGTWRFKLEQAKNTEGGVAEWRAKAAVDYPQNFEPFFKLDYKEGAGWDDIKVPSNWEMSGHSPATYNQPDNASGFYRVWFDVPKSWEGRVVKLNFDGVQNGSEIWLNGQPVKVDEPSWGRENYHEGGWTAFQVDLTPQVKFGKKNLLALRVTKNTKSVELDTGDYFFLGGVHRPVTLFAVPKSHIEDFKVETKANGEVSVAVTSTGGEVSGSIDGHPMQLKDQKLVAVINNPRLWSAEHPNLYGLTIELRDGDKVVETVRERIGIREITIQNAVLLLNGKPIKLAGMCRHDVSAYEGTAIGPETWRKDIELMKAANINAIRTSHYPYGKGFYDLCDELGMYVADELPYCWTPTDDKAMEPAFTQRARETVRRDKNHPCVIVWAVGNENKEGQNLQTVADLVKQMDDTRPRAVSWYGAAKYKTELSDSHYTVAEQIEESAIRAKKVGHPHIYLENPNNWEVRLAADPSCWDAWALVLQKAWNVYMQYDTLPGTFAWEWQDRAVADKSPTKLYYYDKKTGINLLKIKGFVDAFRNPRPWYYHVKMIYSPIRVGEQLSRNGDEVSFDVENRYSFTDLSELEAKWQLIAAGKIIKSGAFAAKLAPLSKGQVTIKLPNEVADADALRIDFAHRSGPHVVGHQFTLHETKPAPLSPNLPKDLAFPQFNLITRITEKDAKSWRKATRFTAKLIDVKQDAKTLDAKIVMDNAPDKVVGKVHAGYDDANKFSYRFEWTGPKADLQELGWIFTMSKSHDRFSWQRDALWTVYPEGHIGRPSGTARPDSMDVPLTKISRPDAFDFNSTKYNCREASLTDERGDGVRVIFTPDARHHCRGGVSENGYTLAVNKQVNPPQDISSKGVSELFMNLNPGDKIESSFTVGSAK